MTAFGLGWGARSALAKVRKTEEPTDRKTKPGGVFDGSVPQVLEEVSEEDKEKLQEMEKKVEDLRNTHKEALRSIYVDLASLKPSYLWELAASRGKGNPVEALHGIDVLLKQHPDYGRAHITKGAILAQLGELDAGIQSTRHGIEILREAKGQEEYYFLGHSNLGFLLAERGKPADGKEAIRIAETAHNARSRFIDDTRDEFKRVDWSINYGRAFVTFNRDPEDLGKAIIFLTGLLSDDHVGPKQTTEISRYLSTAAQALTVAVQADPTQAG